MADYQRQLDQNVADLMPDDSAPSVRLEENEYPY